MNSTLMSRGAMLAAAGALVLSTVAQAQNAPGSWLPNAFSNDATNIQNDITNGGLTANQGSRLQQWESKLQNKYNQYTSNGGSLNPWQARGLANSQRRLNQALHRDVWRNQSGNGFLGNGNMPWGGGNSGWRNGGGWQNWNNNGSFGSGFGYHHRWMGGGGLSNFIGNGGGFGGGSFGGCGGGGFGNRFGNGFGGGFGNRFGNGFGGGLGNRFGNGFGGGRHWGNGISGFMGSNGMFGGGLPGVAWGRRAHFGF